MEEIVRKRVEYMTPVIDSPEFMVFTYAVDNDERDPLKIDIGDDDIAFRLVETHYKVVDGEEEEDYTEATSNWYCNGEKLTLDEVIGRYGHLPKYKTLIDNLIEEKIDVIYHTKTDHWIELADDEMSIDEYRKLREESKTKSKKLNKEGNNNGKNS
jgi:hypothetical protein